jgi:hypothetical protein
VLTGKVLLNGKKRRLDYGIVVSCFLLLIRFLTPSPASVHHTSHLALHSHLVMRYSFISFFPSTYRAEREKISLDWIDEPRLSWSTG